MLGFIFDSRVSVNHKDGFSSIFQQFLARLWTYVQFLPRYVRVNVYFKGSYSKDKVKLFVHNREHTHVTGDISSMEGYFRQCNFLAFSGTNRAVYRCSCDIGITTQIYDVGCRYLFLAVKPGITLCDVRINIRK